MEANERSIYYVDKAGVQFRVQCEDGSTTLMFQTVDGKKDTSILFLASSEVFGLYTALGQWIGEQAQQKGFYRSGHTEEMPPDTEPVEVSDHPSQYPAPPPIESVICIDCNGVGQIFSHLDFPPTTCTVCKGVGRLKKGGV